MTVFSIVNELPEGGDTVSELSSGTDWTLRGLPVLAVPERIKTPIELVPKTQQTVRVDLRDARAAGVIPLKLPIQLE